MSEEKLESEKNDKESEENNQSVQHDSILLSAFH